MNDADCRFGSGDVITRDDLSRLLSEDCTIEAGAVIRLYYVDDDRGDLVDSGSGSGSVKEVVPRVVERHIKHRHKPMEIIMNEVPNGSGAALPVPSAPLTLPAPSAQPIAQTVPPPAAPFDVNSLVGAAGGGGGLAVILALIAVAGGTAGWKFWQKLSEQKHEQKMKELELKAASSAQQDKSPQQCSVAHAAFEARIGALEAKLTTVEQKSLSLDADFDAGAVDKRLDKIEKALKIAKRT